MELAIREVSGGGQPKAYVTTSSGGEWGKTRKSTEGRSVLVMYLTLLISLFALTPSPPQCQELKSLSVFMVAA